MSSERGSPQGADQAHGLEPPVQACFWCPLPAGRALSLGVAWA